MFGQFSTYIHFHLVHSSDNKKNEKIQLRDMNKIEQEKKMYWNWSKCFFSRPIRFSLWWCRSPIAAGAGAASAATEYEHRDKYVISGLGGQKLDTLFRHYYPETGYAYVILTLAILVAIIIHGFHLSGSIFLIPAQNRFHVGAVECVGECVNEKSFYFPHDIPPSAVRFLSLNAPLSMIESSNESRTCVVSIKIPSNIFIAASLPNFSS